MLKIILVLIIELEYSLGTLLTHFTQDHIKIAHKKDDKNPPSPPKKNMKDHEKSQ
jgi:hypothetical protein